MRPSFDQVVAEVLDKVRALVFESFFKGMIEVADRYLELGLKLFLVVPATSGKVSVRRLPCDLNVELLNANIPSLPNFVELLLVKEIRMVKEAGIALNFDAVP